MNYVRTLGIFLMLFLAACVPQQADEVTIGFIGPFSGDVAVYGEAIDKMVRIGLEEVNVNRDVPIRFITEDGECTAKGGANAAQKLVNVDGVSLLYVLCSPEVLGAAPVAEENQVILFSPFAGNPDITNAGDYVFRNFPSDATSGSKVAEYALRQGVTRAAILAELNDYSQAVKSVFTATFEAEGGVIVADESFASDASDVRTQITKIVNADVDAVYFAPLNPNTAATVLRQMQELGLDTPLYTNEVVASADFIREHGEFVNGAVYAEPDFDPTRPKAAAFLTKVEERYGEVPGTLPPVYYAAAYDAVQIFGEAIDACGENTNCIKDFMYAIEDRQGTASTLTIDANGDPLFEYVVKEIRDGAIVEVR